jgi:hypothetical protein
MRLVTWHDGRGLYPKLAEGLARSADAVGLETDCIRWVEQETVGAAQKLRLKTIRRVSAEHPDDDLLVVDADCVIHSFPKMLDGWKSLAFPYWADKWFSGVWYLPRGMHRGLVEGMEETWEKMPLAVERDVLNEVLGSPRLRPEAVLMLPVEYAWVEPMHRKTNPAAQPVIEHFMVNMGGRLTLRRLGLA